MAIKWQKGLVYSLPTTPAWITRDDGNLNNQGCHLWLSYKLRVLLVLFVGMLLLPSRLVPCTCTSPNNLILILGYREGHINGGRKEKVIYSCIGVSHVTGNCRLFQALGYLLWYILWWIPASQVPILVSSPSFTISLNPLINCLVKSWSHEMFAGDSLMLPRGRPWMKRQSGG